MHTSSADVDIEKFVIQCSERGIRFRIDEGQLRTLAPPGAIDAELSGQIRAAKAGLIAFLGQGLSPQQRAWRTEQQRGAPLVAHSTALRLDGADPAALIAALNAVIARHPILRTGYDGHFVPHTLDRLRLDVARTDLAAHTEAERQAALEAIGTAFAQQPFELARGEVLRAMLVGVSAERHVLLLALHPLAADEESVDLLVEDLLAALDTSIDAGLPVPYAELGEVNHAWWQDSLADHPEAHSLPLDVLRSRHQAGGAGRLQQRLGRELTARLTALARTEGCSLSLVLHSALAALFARWSGNADIVLGTPVSTRPPGVLMIGPVAQTVALRARVSEECTFRRLLSDQAHAYAQAREHLPAPAVSCQIRFGMRCAPAWRWPNAARVQLPATRTLFDLDIEARQDGDDILLAWTFADALFLPDSIQGMMASYALLLAGAAADPERCVHDLPLLTAADETRLAAWNATQRPYRRDICVHQMVEQQVVRTPQATALIAGEQSLTYAELDGKANALAHALRAAGVQPGEPVPVMLHSGLEVPLCYLAAMKAGAVFAPVDVNWPVQRQAAVLERMAPRVVLTTPGTLDPALAPAVQRLEVDLTLLAPASRPDLPCDPIDPIYVVHTSGSTGEPKGAINLHRGIVNRLSFMDRYFGRGGNDVVLQTTHHCFDSAIWQFFWPLTRGGTCVIPLYAQHFELGDIVALVMRHHVTLTDFTPALLMLFAEHIEQLPENVRQHCCLRDLIAGGEELTLPVVRKFQAALPQVKLHNFYGPSETSIGVLCCEITAADLRRPIPIGKPIDNVVTAIVDAHLRPVPVGMPGELLLGGDCVGAGYLRNEAETARRFIHVALPQFQGTKAYRTGDLVRMRHDGNVEFLGRIDTQVKIRGFRIELSEIQSRIEVQPGVRQAVVRTEGEGSARELVAFVVPGTGAPDPDRMVADLQAALQRELPDYMVPKAYVLLAEMPLLPNGKVDTRQLAGERLPRSTRPFAAPASESELELARIWATLFNLERVSLHDDFFELGGHSLLATQFVARVRRQMNAEIPLRALFDNPRLDALSRWFDDHRKPA